MKVIYNDKLIFQMNVVVSY